MIESRVLITVIGGHPGIFCQASESRIELKRRHIILGKNGVLAIGFLTKQDEAPKAY
jgi:hypothetical protein